MPSELSQPYSLDEKSITKFREEGFIRLPKVLHPETLSQQIPEIDRIVNEQNRLKDVPLAERSLYDQAFLQIGNLWQQSDGVRQLACSERLARIATELMGTQGVRMWHDQALYKEPSGGFTPWHVDQQYWPMATAMSVTAWIPLQSTPLEMGPLCFGRGSHRKRIGRDLEIGDESERQILEATKKHKILEVQEPYEWGDVSFHLGWTLHRAGPNTTEKTRRVFTVIYMDDEMRLVKPKNRNQQADWEAWTPSTPIGEIMDDALNPVLYRAERSGEVEDFTA